MLIYGLIDPRTGLIRYVGRTDCTLARRLRLHIGKAKRGNKNSKVAQWIQELISSDEKPTIALLEETDDASAEERWITMLKSRSVNLTNTYEDGQGANFPGPGRHKDPLP